MGAGMWGWVGSATGWVKGEIWGMTSHTPIPPPPPHPRPHRHPPACPHCQDPPRSPAHLQERPHLRDPAHHWTCPHPSDCPPANCPRDPHPHCPGCVPGCCHPSPRCLTCPSCCSCCCPHRHP